MAVIRKRLLEYANYNPVQEAAAKRGYVDNIIEPDLVRKHAIYSFEMLFSKVRADLRKAWFHMRLR